MTDPVAAISILVFGLVLFLLVLVDYKHIGLLGLWEPRTNQSRRSICLAAISFNYYDK